MRQDDAPAGPDRAGAGLGSWYAGAGVPYRRPPWLIRLRAVTATLQLAVCVVAWLLPDLDLPLREVWPLLLVLAVANGGMVLRVTRGHDLPDVVVGGVLLLELVLLTGLLELTGGPFNPFSVIYGVQVAVAAFTLGRSWAGLTGTGALLAYGMLVYTHLQADAAGHHRLNDFPTHLFTMWVAAAITAELVGFFVTQATNAIEQRQRELEAVRNRAYRSERVAALTTLAAGAAHELSTPLGTIAVAAKELERATARLAPEYSPPGLHEDATLIRTEVDRCQAILDQMSGRAGGRAADELEWMDLPSVVAQVRDRLPRAQAARLRVQVDDLGRLSLPRAGLVQVMASLVKNAFEASGDDQEVWLDATRDDGELRLTIRDAGVGIDEADQEHVGEPFYTTKDGGRGLGLFLARVFAERFGGSLTLRSQDGARVTLLLPILQTGKEGRT